MTGHRPFRELRDELMSAPGAEEREASARKRLEEELCDAAEPPSDLFAAGSASVTRRLASSARNSGSLRNRLGRESSGGASGTRTPRSARTRPSSSDLLNMVVMAEWVIDLASTVMPDPTPLEVPLLLRGAAALIGEDVVVRLSDVEDPDVLVRGRLLGFSDMGTAMVLQGDGDVHHVWPMLAVGLDGGEL